MNEFNLIHQRNTAMDVKIMIEAMKNNPANCYQDSDMCCATCKKLEKGDPSKF